ncbi:MAG: GH92 family glycosyl hydrolase [Tannerella sp.]|jgi:predicted alpha-1,2-mannosidase|nr:GH92 family glycosyl hydrolase [Tannerella sp.]
MKLIVVKIRNLFLVGIMLFSLSCSTQTSIKQPVDYIDPFIGASTSTGKAGVLHGMGKTFPGAATPFGLVQLSPNTVTGKDHGPGYSYEHPTIKGFAFLQMSGIGWGGDLGNFLVMPTTGELKTSYGKEEQPENTYRSRYDKATERASAGYYDVTLTDYNIRTEFTAAPRSGILRFTYPENSQSRIQIDLARRVGGTSIEQYVKVEDEYTISGWMKCTPDGGGWGNGRGKVDYTVYFYSCFDRPLKTFGVWSADIPDDWVRKVNEVTSDAYLELVANAEIIPECREMQGKHLGFFTEFPTAKNEQVLMKCGISLVNIEGAKANLEVEIPDWDFERVHSQARQLWNDALSVIQLEGGTDKQKTIFYTGLYHTMIDPRIVSDVNGNYRGADGIHQTGDFAYRSIFSGWDVFRSQFPLQTLINPEMVNDEVNSLITLAEQSGNLYYPRWELLNAYTGCMIGTPAIPVIVGAYEKGIRRYDVEKAYRYAKNTADKFSNNAEGYSPGSLSETLEYTFSDWCVGRFAERLGKIDDSQKYFSKSLLYVNSYDPEVQWMRTRKADGSWLEWEGKTVHNQGTKESNPYQQGWFVPHDVQGLINLMGKEHFDKELITFFEKTPDSFDWNDYYNHPNEPVHHVAFMFTYTGLPHLAQKWSRIICENAYDIGVYGLKGNEDVGQMSAWYILAAMGFHPVNPAEDTYIIGSPLFDKVTLRLDPAYYTGKEFVIKAHNNSPENVYIQSATLNEKPLSRAWLLHSEIVAGGTLEFQMGPTPNKEWGVGEENLPPSQSKK